MNEEKLLQRLAARARLEAPPTVNVVDRVMAIIREEESCVALAPNPMAWIAGFSAAAAVPAALLGFAAWNTWTNPLLMLGTLVRTPWEALL